MLGHLKHEGKTSNENSYETFSENSYDIDSSKD